MTELDDNEKKRLVQVATEQIRPIAEKYELDSTAGMAALFEAFQAGVKFSWAEVKKIEEEQRREFKF